MTNREYGEYVERSRRAAQDELERRRLRECGRRLGEALIERERRRRQGEFAKRPQKGRRV